MRFLIVGLLVMVVFFNASAVSAKDAALAPKAQPAVQAQPTQALPMPGDKKAEGNQDRASTSKANKQEKITSSEQASPKSNAEVAAKVQTPAKVNASKKKEAPKAGGKKTGDVGSALEVFALDIIDKINVHSLHAENKKKVVKNPDGTYSAHYKAVDRKSLRTSYSKPDNAKSIAFIGHIAYEEVSYVCVGENAAAVKNAPCKELLREPMQELVKHKNGRWTY